MARRNHLLQNVKPDPHLPDEQNWEVAVVRERLRAYVPAIAGMRTA